MIFEGNPPLSIRGFNPGPDLAADAQYAARWHLRRARLAYQREVPARNWAIFSVLVLVASLFGAVLDSPWWLVPFVASFLAASALAMVAASNSGRVSRHQRLAGRYIEVSEFAREHGVTNSRTSHRHYIAARYDEFRAALEADKTAETAQEIAHE